MRTLELPRVEAAKLLIDMGADVWQLYCVMRLVADENDVVSVQQGDFAALMRCTRQTVYNRLKKLTDYRIQGVPLVRVDEHGGAGYWNTYRVMWDVKGALTITGITMSDVSNGFDSLYKKEPSLSVGSVSDDKLVLPATENESDGVLRTARDVMTYWSQQYEAKYGKRYEVMNWGKEMGFAKRLLTKYGTARGKVILRSIITNYDAVWKTPKFPTPTLGQAVSWLGKQAEEYADNSAAPEPDDTADDGDLDALITKGLI